MNDCTIALSGARLTPYPSGALFWEAQSLLVVSDLHLGKSDRIARSNGLLLPPYETRDTLTRLASDLDKTKAKTLLCLGDSFDDPAAADALCDDDLMALAGLQAGRKWIWIEGNHDPGSVGLGGTHRTIWRQGPLIFRHIAEPGAAGEVSGHYHPKARLAARGRVLSRPCFLFDSTRVVLPAYGTYTGGLGWTEPALRGLFGRGAHAAILGDPVRRVPVPA
ncbi:MAG: ligase-associated DNA damage response endonuclease PdeM [Pseudomonadota bacterium]